MTSDDIYLRLATLESQIGYLLNYLGIDPATAASDWSAAGPMMSGPLPGDAFDAVPRPGPIAGPLPAGGTPPQVANAIQRGKLIEAIKIYRQMTGLDLKQAKAAVEAMARDMGIRV